MQQSSQEIPLSAIPPGAYRTLDEEDSASQKSRFDSRTLDSSQIMPFIPSKRYFGRNFTFWFRNNEPRITLGPHWYLFVITWCVMVGGGFYCYVQLSKGSSDLVKLATILAIIWQGFIYGLTALKNPGVVTAVDPNDPNLEKLANHKDFCTKCRIIRDKTTEHCWDCGVCIEGYDHHCPWTGKCIGKGNLYPFYAFLLSTAGYMVFFMLVTFSKLPK